MQYVANTNAKSPQRAIHPAIKMQLEMHQIPSRNNDFPNQEIFKATAGIIAL
jgi:hypothetical protein